MFYLVDPVLHCDHLLGEEGASCFVLSLICGLCTVCHGLFAITKTCLYNVDSLKPHIYIVKPGFKEKYIIFLNSAQHNLCFEQKYEKYQNFYLNICIFWL